jgi:cytoskeletal protein CcmA (bactofilin family)
VRTAEEHPSGSRLSKMDTLPIQEVRMDGRDESSDISVVGPDTRIEGTVVAAGSLRVEGEVKGKSTAEREVTLTPQGRVEANIQATSIVLGGQVKGNLAPKGDVSPPADSRLDGDIRAHNWMWEESSRGTSSGRGGWS